MPAYTVSADGKSITCHHCGKTSHHPNDVSRLYCGHCHAFLGDEGAAKADEAAPLVDRIKKILRGKPPAIQGAVIADLLAIFLAGHHPRLREVILQATVDTARQLIEPNEAAMFPTGFPPGWKDQ